MTLKMSIVLTFAVVLYIVAMQPDMLGFYHDDGVYAVTGKALAEGKGYRIISLPGEPVQMTYPVFYPLVLSVVWRIFPDFPANIPALKAPSIIFTLLFLFATYHYLTRRNYASKRMALAIVLMTAINPWMVWAATMAMSEALYCLVTVLALWVTELFISKTWGGKRKRYVFLALAGMAIAVSIMTRSIGGCILSATFVYLFLNKRRGPRDRRQKADDEKQLAKESSEGTSPCGKAVYSSQNRVISIQFNPTSLPVAQPDECNYRSNTTGPGSTIPSNQQPSIPPSRHIETGGMGGFNQQLVFHNSKSPDRRSRKSSLLKKGFSLGTQLELAVILFLSPWLVWTFMQYINQTNQETFPYRPVFYGSYIQYLIWQWHDYGILFFFKSFILNTYRCFLGALPNMILPGVKIGEVLSFNFLTDYLLYAGIGIAGLVLSVSALYTLVKDILKRSLSLITVYIILILIVILVWPVEPDRFLLPLLPFLLLFFLKGFAQLAKKAGCFFDVLTSKHTPLFSVSILLIFVLLNCGMALAEDMTNIIKARRSVEWIEKRNIFHWVNEKAESNDILVSQVSPALYLYTGLKAIPPIVGIDVNDISIPSLTADIIIKNFRNLLDYEKDNHLYLVKTAYGKGEPPIYEQMIDMLAIKYPGRISLVYAARDMKYAIYKMQ